MDDHTQLEVVPEIPLKRGSAEWKREETAETLLNVLEGLIRNKNTRSAYKVAWKGFFRFCSDYKLELDRVKPYHFGLWLKRYPEDSIARQRQHIAAVRLLFDHLLQKGVVELNPAARAKPPRLDREKAHTPVFEREEITLFLQSIQTETLKDTRDRALFSVLLYTWGRVSAVASLKVKAYYERKGQMWLRLGEKRGKIHEVPVHTAARQALDLWLDRAGIAFYPEALIFPAFGKDRKKFENRPIDRKTVWKMIRTRATACGIKKRLRCHSFRATGITEYMNAGGSLDVAQTIAGHAQLSTTKIYDRSKDRITIEEVERVKLGV